MGGPVERAVVLCAGLGTRLRPLTERWPKPALPLLGQPLLRYGLSMLARAGVRHLGINSHHLPEAMEQVASAEAARLGLSLVVSREEVILGTGGGIRGLRDFTSGGDVWVLNGDILLGLDPSPVLEAHRAAGAAATMVLLPMPEHERFAAVEADAQMRVRRIAGHGPGGPGLAPWHFTGLHLISQRVFDFMEDRPEDINRDVYPRLMAAGLTVLGFLAPTGTYWSDLGTPGRLVSTVQELLFQPGLFSRWAGSSPLEAAVRSGSQNFWAHPEARLGQLRVAGPAYFGARTQVADGVRVGAGVWVGEGAIVEGGAHLNRTVVMDGGRVRADERLEDCVVACEGMSPRLLPALPTAGASAPARR